MQLTLEIFLKQRCDSDEYKSSNDKVKARTAEVSMLVECSLHVAMHSTITRSSNLTLKAKLQKVLFDFNFLHNTFVKTNFNGSNETRLLTETV